MLSKLFKKKSLVVVGMNSGTSADGVDLAALRIVRTPQAIKPVFIAGRSRRFDPALQSELLTLADSPQIDPEKLVRVHNYLGRVFGEAARKFIADLKKHHIHVDAIGSHGQTVRHCPTTRKMGAVAVRGTLQIGSADIIAAMTGCPVVSDFRQAAVALGHEGAPITTPAVRRLFASPAESRLIVNIGGMANYFYFPSDLSKAPTSAADCGPGNAICDLLAKQLLGAPLDRNGAAAARGAVSQRLLTLLLAHPFFMGKTLSTGREEFGTSVAGQILDFGGRHRLPAEDMIATAAELTTMSIALKVWPIVRRDHSLAHLFVAGGGRRNRHFLRRLAHHLPDLQVQAVDVLGIDGDLVEAASYAVMAEACLRGEPLESLPVRSTGRRRASRLQPVLGHISQPPVRVK